MKTLEIGLMRFSHGTDLPAPAYQSAQAAGLDLFAAVPAEVPIVLDPGHWAAIPTGIALTLPPGTEGQVRPRSGLAAVHGITVLNAPGTIDADYRGELKVLLVNLGNRPFAVTRGLRMAQLVIAPVLRVKIAEAARLGETSRGGGGFGSTGSM